ncbi:hypothetical protein [Mesobacillus selenatarsenatis]|uniref:hypothetical protein n=1 Tax=Mesobacillus selenatarsenatis TaxID=388741 RepID=UPI0005A7E4D3|nr:hypothetical protein [Mesobacillus selenatarsenatis]
MVDIVTDLRGRKGKLSKERSTSDRFGFIRRKAVQREVNFGQVRLHPEKSCPKKDQLRTGLRSNDEKVSELLTKSKGFAIEINSPVVST